MHAACNVTIKNTSKLEFRTLFQELGKNSHFPCLKGKLAIKIFFKNEEIICFKFYEKISLILFMKK